MTNFTKKQLQDRAKELGLNAKALNDSLIEKLVIQSMGKENVTFSGGQAAEFDADTPVGTYDNDEFVASGKNISIPYTNPESEFSPFILIEGSLTVDEKVHKGSGSMSPIDYSKTLPQSGDALGIRVKVQASTGLKRASILV
jgi:hypothetical protein